jgi:hypothetical protein
MMNTRETRRYEMLTRVRDFGASHPAAFAPGSHAARLLAVVSNVVVDLAGHSAAQAAGRDVVRAGTANGHQAREALEADLDAIARTARAISRRVPALDGKFRLPKELRAQSLLDVARAFVSESAPFKQHFAELALDDAFFAKVDADIAAFELALTSQRRGRDTRTVAKAAIEQAIEQGVSAVREMGALVHNFYSADQVTLSAWEAASHTRSGGRGGRPRTAAEQPSEASHPPAPAILAEIT